jgi:ABC-2 type transport system ATP-binding protein
LFGDRVHVVTDDLETARRQVEHILDSAGLKVSELRPIEPTLEDIFVSVLAGKEGAE